MVNKGQRIVGIKAIADYLNTSERSVYRWGKELGLPLRRVSGAKGSSVFVYVSELEVWLKTKDASTIGREALKKKAWVVTAVLVLLIASFTAVFFITKNLYNRQNKISPYPITSSISGSLVSIKNDRGDDIWSYIASDLPYDAESWQTRKLVDFFDIDKDGANEVVTPVYDPVNDKFCLTLFDNEGSLLWQRSITNQQTFAGLHLKTHFVTCRCLFAKNSAGEISIVSYWRHKARFLAFITRHDCEGNLLNKYIHCGHIGGLKVYDLDSDGTDEILLGGTNNLLNEEAVLCVLNLEDFGGVCPPYRVEPEYKHLDFRLRVYVPDNPERGRQIAYLRFKKIDRFKPYQRTHSFAHIHDIDEESIHVQLFPWELPVQEQTGGFEYVFTKMFDLKYVIPESHLVKFYPEIFKDAEEKILLNEIIDLFSENVFRWDGSGWIPIRATRPKS